MESYDGAGHMKYFEYSSNGTAKYTASGTSLLIARRMTNTQHYALKPHPGTTPLTPFQLDVTVTVLERNLRLLYELHGDMSAIRIPAQATPQRLDDLWKHTCFELFIADDHSSAYEEFNFSPSGSWAAYQFLDYRQGAQNMQTTAPAFTRWSRAQSATLEVHWPRPIGGLLASRDTHPIGLSAVIEDSQGELTYWSLAHPTEKPDFHNRAGFIGRVGY